VKSKRIEWDEIVALMGQEIIFFPEASTKIISKFMLKETPPPPPKFCKYNDVQSFYFYVFPRQNTG
jgi:hypothetical protein